MNLIADQLSRAQWRSKARANGDRRSWAQVLGAHQNNL